MRTENTIDYADYFKRYGVRFGSKIEFSVDDDGTIYFEEFDENATRREVYSAYRFEFDDLPGLVRCVVDFDLLWMVVKPVYDRFVEKTGKRLREEPDFSEDPDLIIKAARLFGKWKFLHEVKKELDEWLSDRPDSIYEEEFEEAPNPVRSAYRYFRRGRDCKDIGITIVEGEHPGSSYYAARLDVDVDEANEKCIELDLPYVFVEQ